MLQNNVEMDLKMRLIESGTTQTEVAEKVGVSLAYVNRITKGREQIVNKTFVKMMASHLKENMEAQRVLLDPHQDNKRAISAYEKAGFKIIKPLPKHELFEGEKVDCWLMELAL